MKYWVFLLLAGCQGLLQEQIPRVEGPVLGKRLEQGMCKEEVLALLGPPPILSSSAFEREQWSYPNIGMQGTYCNRTSPKLYLFDNEEVEESVLSLLFDEAGRLESFSYFQLKDGMISRSHDPFSNEIRSPGLCVLRDE